MKKLPEGLDGDQRCACLRWRLALGIGVPAGAASGWGEQSMGTRVGAVRSCGAYCVFRRLTIRGEHRLMVRVARVAALACNRSRNHRARRMGCSGGKGPGLGLCAAKEFDMSLEGQVGMRHSVARGALVHQPPDGVVRQHPAEELLAARVPASCCAVPADSAAGASSTCRTRPRSPSAGGTASASSIAGACGGSSSVVSSR